MARTVTTTNVHTSRTVRPRPCPRHVSLRHASVVEHAAAGGDGAWQARRVERDRRTAGDRGAEAPTTRARRTTAGCAPASRFDTRYAEQRYMSLFTARAMASAQARQQRICLRCYAFTPTVASHGIRGKESVSLIRAYRRMVFPRVRTDKWEAGGAGMVAVCGVAG